MKEPRPMHLTIPLNEWNYEDDIDPEDFVFWARFDSGLTPDEFIDWITHAIHNIDPNHYRFRLHYAQREDVQAWLREQRQSESENQR